MEKSTAKGLLSAPKEEPVLDKVRVRMVSENAKAKRRAKNKMQRASRRANRG